MRLKFQEWYKERKFSDLTEDLFDEAVVCYKVSAYRSAFLMSYLGFQNIIRERILNDDRKEDVFTEDTINILNSNERWEFKITTIIQSNNKKEKEKKAIFEDNYINKNIKNINPFKLSKDVEQEYNYWHLIRNNSAHAKGGVITYSTIECFWDFIENNLSNFIINGGKDGLITRVKECYKYKNEKNANDIEDIEVIVDDLVSIGEEKEIYEFLKEVSTILKIQYYNKYNIVNKFWDKIIKFDNKIVKRCLLKLLKEDIDLLLKFIQIYRIIFKELECDYRFMVDLREKEIGKFLKYADSYEERKSIWTLINLILKENNLVEEEQESFIQKIARNSKMPPILDNIDILRNTCYFEELREHLFSYKCDPYKSGGKKHVDNNSEIIEFYLLESGLDTDVVEKVNKMYEWCKGWNYNEYDNRYYYDREGRFSKMIDKLLEDEEFKSKYEEILKKINT
ncbi:MAG: hypothetical protein N4A48_06875 [Tepidibacter sp.]|jgi:hypothetical protein|uniref:hypothetical protein n=1 Tax=Tepidibacter sp. TaxID=2529387 RepID=UPI0025F036CC|nr:hypothetical protein [Tepidibacter sp.]MCT4508472.1 hypothetical protein [Tepidibacter sp.]